MFEFNVDDFMFDGKYADNYEEWLDIMGYPDDYYTWEYFVAQMEIENSHTRKTILWLLANL